jgi:hypothetical protein
MRAMRAALLWTLGVAAVLLAPVAATPATATTFARPAASISSGHHANRPSPAASSSQRSGAADSHLPAPAAVKAGSSSGLIGSGVPGDRAGDTTIARPAAGRQLAGPFEAGPRSGLAPGTHLGRSPPAALGA